MGSAFPALVTILALILYAGTGFNVGRLRGRLGVKAPSVSGPPEFERAFRVQQNTLEQIVVFLPALWLFVWFVSAFWGGIVGVVWIVGRALYAVSYQRDPASRGPGFGIAALSTIVLLLGALAGAIVNLR
jgi:uncharacterized membrane protein YecN with MAPEG domain